MVFESINILLSIPLRSAGIWHQNWLEIMG